jgi:high-affinity Fe2+/Pb2+ permease
VKLGAEMENYYSVAMAIAMVAAFLLIAGGVKLALQPQTRGRGALMIAVAVVLVMNVMIWTV